MNGSRAILQTFFVLFLAAMLPGAGASSTIDGGLVVIRVEDQHGYGCHVPLAGACVFNVTSPTSELGDTTIDASQTLRYVGVATNLSMFKDAIGDAWIVPDADVTVFASEVYIPNPFFRMGVDTWRNTVGGTWPSEKNGVRLDEGGITIQCECPGTADGGAPTEWRNRSYTPGPWGSKCITYDRVAPCNAYNSTSLDFVVNGNAERLCTFEELPCDDLLLPGIQAAQSQTPNVAAGVQYEEAQLTTDPSNLEMDAQHKHPSHPAILDRAYRTPGTALDFGIRGRAPLFPWSEDPPSPAGGPTPDRPSLGPDEDSPASQTKALQQGIQRRDVLALAAVTAFASIMVLLTSLFLYSRFSSKSELLASPLRQKLLGLVEATPGIHLRQLSEELGLTRQAVARHVHLLRRAGLVRVVEDGWRTRVYATGTVPPSSSQHAEPEGHRPNCELVLSLLRASPEGLPRAGVHDALKHLPRRQRNRILKHLLDARLIQEVRAEGDLTRLRVSSLLAPAW